MKVVKGPTSYHRRFRRAPQSGHASALLLTVYPQSLHVFQRGMDDHLRQLLFAAPLGHYQRLSLSPGERLLSARSGRSFNDPVQEQ